MNFQGKMVHNKSQKSIAEENENISDEDMGEEKQSKLKKYDSSYFSLKMLEAESKNKKGEEDYSLSPTKEMKERLLDL